MLIVLRNLIFYPTLFLFNRIIKRFALLLMMVFLTTSLILLYQYVQEKKKNSAASAGNAVQKTELYNDFVEDTTIVTIKKGDTLESILRKEGIAKEDIIEISALAKKEKIVSKLQIGKDVVIEYNISLTDSSDSDLSNEKRSLKSVTIILDKINSIEFVKNGDHFTFNKVAVALTRMVTKYETVIESSVISSLKKVGLSTNSIVNLIEAYSHQIDFQRQIKNGDRIAVITEKFMTPDNKFSHHGKVIYASIISGKNEYKIYSYAPNGDNNTRKLFSEDGKSIKSTLLRTPVNVVRISGHFGFRKKHPVHGYSAMHKGVDFAGPVGTPIYAAGDGVVTFLGWKSGYGRFVIIKHNNHLETAYAHSSAFAKHLKQGSKVKQGDIIAYIGASGNTTGPHLHFEVRIDGKQVNPMKFKSSPGVVLAGTELNQFKQFQSRINELNNKLNNGDAVTDQDMNILKI